LPDRAGYRLNYFFAFRSYPTFFFLFLFRIIHNESAFFNLIRIFSVFFFTTLFIAILSMLQIAEPKPLSGERDDGYGFRNGLGTRGSTGATS
jgi:hypothetical protein